MKVSSHAELTAWATGSEQLWLFLDYDGTLADFAPTPEHIEPHPEIVQLIEQLARRPGLRLTVLSGRRLRQIRELLPVPGILFAGTYGIEILEEAGGTLYRVDYVRVRPILDRVKPRWAELIRGRKGFFLEDKEWALALHARFAEEEEAGQVLGQALEIATLELPADFFRLLGGHKFLEVAPRLASKRETVTYLLDTHPLPGARLLYIGDDDKDEEAFPVIHERGGLAVKVRQASQAARPTSADFFFGSPAETLSWLATLL